MTVVSFILEVLRVFFVVIVGSSLLFALESWVYSIAGKDILANAWMLAIANLTIIFVFYRNVLQFSGWFISKNNKRLKKPLTMALLGVSLILIACSFIMQ